MTDSRPGTPHRTAGRYLRMADRLLPGRITGFYLVGSAALDAWRPGRSDIDFAVVPDARHSPDVENPELLLDTLVPTWRTWLRYDYHVRQQPMVA